MLGVNPKTIYTVAKKEFIDNIRSRWIMLISLIFIILTIVAAYVSGGSSDEIFGGFEATVVSLMSISSLLIPIIAIMLGFSTIAGEAESGSLSVVLSYPVKRVEVLIGKFLGLGAVLAVTPLIGFGISGLIIAAFIGIEKGLAFLVFIALTIVLGLMYLSLIICFSALVKNRTRAIAAGVGLFFWAMIYGLIITAIYIGTGGDITQLATGTANYPEWLFGSIVFSPGDLNQMAVMKAFGLNQAFGVSVDVPSWLNMPFVIIVQLIWIVVPMGLAYRFFKNRDL